MSSMCVLVIDDEFELRESISEVVKAMGHPVLEAQDGEEGLDLLKARGTEGPEGIHMVLLDMNLPGMNGLEVLRNIKEIDPSVSVLMITAHGNIRDAVEAMREGAHNYIEKPVQEADISALVRQAQEAHTLVRQMGLSSPRMKLDDGREFIGHSRQMRSLFEMIQRLGHVTTSVLIRGENGTGKELVAKAIHFNSPRKNRPFVAVNCAAIPENLIESELFGHEKGAFTGADKRHIGKFQFAEGGTLFLDEIGDISPAMQVKLLRVLQERKFMPIGSNREIRCDVRIVAATNRDLEERISRGEFRQDLFYRLNVVPIELPPLRDRTDDIPNLVEYFIQKFNERHERAGGQRIQGIRPEALEALKAHDWPGNIRELENVIERAFILETDKLIGLESVPEGIGTAAGRPGSAASRGADAPEAPVDGVDYHGEKERFERAFIIKALNKFGGRINQTAAHAGIPKNTLLRKMKKYEIRQEEYVEGNSRTDTERKGEQ